MYRYRNEVPHSVIAQAKIYASDSVSVVQLGMTTPELSEFDAISFAVTDEPPLRICVDQKRIDVPSGSYLPINPGQPGSSDGFYRVARVYFVCVDPALVEEIEQTLFNRHAIRYPNHPVRINNELRGLLAAYIAEAAAKQTGSKFILASCGSALAGCLLRDAACSLLGVEQVALKHACIKRAIEYLRDNLAADCRLAEVASAANLSPFHLIRVFKAETGRTPHDYLVDLRIARARELLAGDNFTIKEIACRCGFQEPGSFSRIFRQKVGASPREYRLDASRGCGRSLSASCAPLRASNFR